MSHGWASNESLLEWTAHTPDLQSGTLNHSHYAIMAQHRELGEWSANRTLSAAECDAMMTIATQVRWARDVPMRLEHCH